MKATKALALAGLAVLSVFTLKYGLKLATDGLLVDDEATHSIAEAGGAQPRAILAPATGTPVAEAATPAPLAPEPARGEERRFGAPDPDFGQAAPASGDPAWGAAELARRAEAEAAQAALEPAP